MIGRGTDASAANRTVSICLTVDSGKSCYSKSFDLVLPQTLADSGVLPASFPAPIFAGWGKAVLRSQLPTTGAVDVSGGVVALTGPLAGNAFFNTNLAPGSKIYISGSAPACDHNLCTVVEVQDATHLLVQEILQLRGVTAIVANFGVRVMKPTGIGEVSLSLSYENAWSFPVTMPVVVNNIERGITSPVMKAALTLPRNKKRTRITSAAPSVRLRETVLMVLSTSVVLL